MRFPACWRRQCPAKRCQSLRPEVLFPLYAPVITLPGVGPRLGKLFERLAGPFVVDLLCHLPTGIIDRRLSPKVREACAGTIATLTVQVDGHLPGHGKRPYRVRCRDDTGFLHLVFFHAKADYLARQLQLGATRIVSGRVEHFNNEIQITHPDYILSLEEVSQLKPIEPVYKLTAGLTLRMVQKAVTAALGRTRDLPEWLDPELRRRHGWSDWHAALLQAHAPDNEDALDPSSLARQRLAYDELLANQTAIALVRANNRRLSGRRIAGDGRLRRSMLEALPFRLTGSQLQALAEIDADMAAPARMMRLLQGDVGSGKTVVALLAMLNAVECGGQAVLMAPTEILCRQHLATIETLARSEEHTSELQSPCNLVCRLLLEKKKTKRISSQTLCVTKQTFCPT